jgi:glyoxylase-like metal-dependent hydrolase (beta-lactamase superfamily II)
MHLKVLGTKGEIEGFLPYHSKQSGLLIDNRLLVDLGNKIYLGYHPQWILITHLHPDHAYFIRHGQEEIPATDAQIYVPEETTFGFQILNKKKKLGPYKITPIPTHHSKHVFSQAYLVEKKGKSLLYTGDLVWIDKKYHHLFNLLDLVIADGSFLREGGLVRKDLKTGKLYGHNGIPNLIRLFRPYTKKILFIHFGSWFFESAKVSRIKLTTLGKKYQMEVHAGYDGMELQI